MTKRSRGGLITESKILRNTVSEALESVLPEQVHVFISTTSYIYSVLYLRRIIVFHKFAHWHQLNN